MNRCFAIYRLPDEGTLVRLVEADRATMLRSPRDMDGRTGFAIAPFEATEATPYLYIEGAAQVLHLSEEVHKPFERAQSPLREATTSKEEKAFEQYCQQFELFHRAIEQGLCSKIVLARRSDEQGAEAIPPRELFHRACQSFPHCFVALFHTPQTGMWLTATPEILLEQTDGQMHTMALAGTMAAPDNEDTGQPWSHKNRTEQQYVATYLRTQLAPLTDNLDETAPRTFVAGNVMHLRSDFRFTPKVGLTLGDMAATLHPTPAVCGTPTETARRFILTHEQHPRAYYSGYCGPVSPREAHLYVMLRCMHINGNRYQLYAGGGLVAESQVRDEWEETEAKLYAMRKVKTSES